MQALNSRLAAFLLTSILAASASAEADFSVDYLAGVAAKAWNSSEKSSGVSSATTSLQCKGIKFPKLPSFNIAKLIESLSGKIGFCEVSTNNQNLKCASSLLSKYSNTANLLPAGSALRGKTAQLSKEACSTSSDSSPSASTVASLGQSLFTYQSDLGRKCLALGGGSACKTLASKLPTSSAEHKTQVADSVQILSAGRSLGVTEIVGAEYGMASSIQQQCDGAWDAGDCASNSAGSSLETRTSRLEEALSLSSSSEFDLVTMATTPHKYFFETSEELKNNLPIHKRASFVAGAKRTMSAEAFFKKQSAELAKIELELVEASKNKIIVGSMPVLQSSISKYTSEISGALDGLSIPE